MLSGSIVRRELSATVPVRFAPVWGLVLFILIVVTVLFFLFPKEELLDALNKQRQADKVVKQYLTNLVDLYPQDQSFKLLLAEQHLGLADVEKAFSAIQPYLAKKDVKSSTYMKALWIYYRILQVTTFALPPSSETRLAGENKLKTLVKQLTAVDLNTERLLQLGNGAAQLGMNQEALGLYQRVVEKPVSKEAGMSELYAKAAQLALGYSQYTFTAQLYFLAQKSAPNEKLATSYYIQALQSLVAGNLLTLALEQAQANLNGLSNNQEALLYLVSLARRANNTELAQQYMLKILKLTYQDNDN
jgi:hypothetical protein